MIRPHDLATYPLPQIRRAIPSDISAIVAIEKDSFIDPWEQSVFLEALTYYPATYFVAVCDGMVAGFVVGGLEDTGENIYGHLCNLGVSPRYRRRGVGKLLVRRVEHQFALELATGVRAGSAGFQYASADVLPQSRLPGSLRDRALLRQRGRCPRHDEMVQVLREIPFTPYIRQPCSLRFLILSARNSSPGFYYPEKTSGRVPARMVWRERNKKDLLSPSQLLVCAGEMLGGERTQK